MQHLHFESAWDKTVSIKDREYIHQVFQKTRLSNNENIQLTPLWQAVNYKSDVLITVLIHNYGEDVLSFHNQKLLCCENDEIIAEHTFTLPIPISANTSTPWTFIFPRQSMKHHPRLDSNFLITFSSI